MQNRIRKSLKIIIIVLIVFALLNLVIMFRPVEKENLVLSGKGCLVLCYHRVLDSNPLSKFINNLKIVYSRDEELSLYSVYSDDFSSQLKYLKEHGAQYITVHDLDMHLHEGMSIPEKSVLVTFDDADISLYDNAFPILLKNHIPFTLFLITGHIGDNDFKGLKMCTAPQIQEMLNSGLAAVGSHTNDLHMLNKEGNPPFLSPENIDVFYSDAIKSISEIKKYFGVKCTYFSYPYGFGTPETDEILLNMDMRLIFTLESGTVKADDPSFCIKRVLVNQGTWDAIKRWGSE